MKIKFPKKDLSNPESDLSLYMDNIPLDVIKKFDGTWKIYYGTDTLKDEIPSRKEALEWIEDNLEIKVVILVI
jgi:hypothetical protein